MIRNYPSSKALTSTVELKLRVTRAMRTRIVHRLIPVSCNNSRLIIPLELNDLYVLFNNIKIIKYNFSIND